MINSPLILRGPLAGQRTSGKSFGSTEMRGFEMTVNVSMTESMSAFGGVCARNGPKAESRYAATCPPMQVSTISSYLAGPELLLT